MHVSTLHKIFLTHFLLKYCIVVSMHGFAYSTYNDEKVSLVRVWPYLGWAYRGVELWGGRGDNTFALLAPHTSVLLLKMAPATQKSMQILKFCWTFE